LFTFFSISTSNKKILKILPHDRASTKYAANLQRESSLEGVQIPPSNASTPPLEFGTAKYEAFYALALPE
jgi:hypothetical protein